MVEVFVVSGRPAPSFGNAFSDALRPKMNLMVVVQIAGLIDPTNRRVQMRNTTRRIQMQPDSRLTVCDMRSRRNDFARLLIGYLLIVKCRRKLLSEFFPVIIGKVARVFFGRAISMRIILFFSRG